MEKKRVLVFASGGPNPNDGGSGFLRLVEFTRASLNAGFEIVGVVSNYELGGVRSKAVELGVPFRYWGGPYDAEGYQKYVKEFEADIVMCSGWLKFVKGLPVAMVINIHPGLPEFGGPGMHGKHVHEAVMAAYRRGGITHSGLFMHFVNEEYDRGPIIFKKEVPIFEDDTADTLARRVNKEEHIWQSHVLNMVALGKIYLENGIVVRKDEAVYLPI